MDSLVDSELLEIIDNNKKINVLTSALAPMTKESFVIAGFTFKSIHYENTLAISLIHEAHFVSFRLFQPAFTCLKSTIEISDQRMISTPFFINNQKFEQSPQKSLIC